MKLSRWVPVIALIGAILAPLPVAAVARAGAAAPTPAQILSTCEHDGYVLQGNYSLASLHAAYKLIPPSNLSYDACAQVITNRISAIVSQKKVHGGSGSGSSFPWVVVVIVLIVLAGGAAAVWAWRRSQALDRPEDH